MVSFLFLDQVGYSRECPWYVIRLPRRGVYSLSTGMFKGLFIEFLGDCMKGLYEGRSIRFSSFLALFRGRMFSDMVSKLSIFPLIRHLFEISLT